MNPADPFGLVGQVLDGQFRVERLVGEGGFSAVYRGHHLGLDEPIAIKCLKLPPALGAQLVDTFVQRFRDESRILYRLSQGNLHIVRSIAAGATSSPSVGFVVPYMVLEWLEGRSLANDLAVRKATGKQGRSLAEVVSLFGTAADALALAHAQGVVHRDLNAGNLFLAQTPHVAGAVKMKVLDFGVAKLLDDSTLNLGPRAQTMGQIRIFAPAYGAPEQFDDAVGRVGPHSDVYSFALILLEALRDRPVYDASNLGEFATAAVDPSRRPTPRALGIDVPDAVEQVFARATRLAPAERFANVGEMWKAFEAAVTTGGNKNDRPGAPRPAASPLGRTLPLNSPNLARAPLPRPGGGAGAGAAGGPSAPNVPVIAPLEGEEDDDAPTRVGALHAEPEPAPAPREEEEEDVTRIRAPEPEILRAASESIPIAPPAAGAPPPPREHESEPPPSLGGGATLMVHPASAVPIPPPPAPFVPGHAPAVPEPPPPRVQPHAVFGSTVALGQSPFHAPAVAPAPAPAPAPPPPMQPAMQPHMQAPHMQPPHMQQAPQAVQAPNMPMGPGPQAMAPGMPAHFAPPQQQPPFGYPGAQAQPGFAEPVPAKKSPTGVILAVVAVVVLGLGGVAAFLFLGREPAPVVTAPTAAPTPDPVPAPSPAPTPPPVVDPTPTPAPTAAADTDAGAATAADTAPTPTATAAATTTATATAAPTAANWAPSTSTATAAAVPVPVPVPKPTPEPVDPNAWNESAARARLAQANGVLVFCRQPDGPKGPGSATVTFAPDGTVSNVTMDPPYAGTKAGDCVAGQFKRAKVNAFDGASRTIKHSFEVPK